MVRKSSGTGHLSECLIDQTLMILVVETSTEHLLGGCHNARPHVVKQFGDRLIACPSDVVQSPVACRFGFLLSGRHDVRFRPLGIPSGLGDDLVYAVLDRAPAQVAGVLERRVPVVGEGNWGEGKCVSASQRSQNATRT